MHSKGRAKLTMCNGNRWFVMAAIPDFRRFFLFRKGQGRGQNGEVKCLMNVLRFKFEALASIRACENIIKLP